MKKIIELPFRGTIKNVSPLKGDRNDPIVVDTTIIDKAKQNLERKIKNSHIHYKENSQALSDYSYIVLSYNTINRTCKIELTASTELIDEIELMLK